MQLAPGNVLRLQAYATTQRIEDGFVDRPLMLARDLLDAIGQHVVDVAYENIRHSAPASASANAPEVQDCRSMLRQFQPAGGASMCDRSRQ